MAKHRRSHGKSYPGSRKSRSESNRKGKKGSRPNLLVDGRGVAWSLFVSGANRPDVTQLEIVWDEIVIERVDDIEPQPCADKGYNGDPA